MYDSAFAYLQPRVRRNWTYSRGIFSFTPAGRTLLSDQSLHQVGKLQKICRAEERAALADHDLWIRRDDVRPLARHRANAISVDL
jgi:hypothetical protein